MRLLKGIKPGRLPDEYLLLTLQLISSAAQQPRDREVIKQRALALRSRDRTHGGTIFVILVMEGVWALADAEGRPIMWSDKAISRRRVMDMLLSKR
ncbi:hypothetical protein B0J17DRAFT_42555 [Rhizoctonia solani]|nr:hypothetical protein B0J17DRAFT_42555 [Rhizoctonia solani]